MRYYRHFKYEDKQYFWSFMPTFSLFFRKQQPEKWSIEPWRRLEFRALQGKKNIKTCPLKNGAPRLRMKIERVLVFTIYIDSVMDLLGLEENPF